MYVRRLSTVSCPGRWPVLSLLLDCHSLCADKTFPLRPVRCTWQGRFGTGGIRSLYGMQIHRLCAYLWDSLPWQHRRLHHHHYHYGLGTGRTQNHRPSKMGGETQPLCCKILQRILRGSWGRNISRHAVSGAGSWARAGRVWLWSWMTEGSSCRRGIYVDNWFCLRRGVTCF